MEKMKFATREEWSKMLEEEDAYYDRTGDFYLKLIASCTEIDGKLYSTWEDTRNGNCYATPTTKTVHMGFNSNDDGKLEEFIANVEKYGECEASYGVTGRTMHEILAHRLATELPQYEFEIGYNYKCIARKRK